MIYAISAPTVRAVKIGMADDVSARFDALRTASPVPLKIEGICAGGFQEEHLLHKLFARHLRHLEWFDAAVLPIFLDLAGRPSPEQAIRGAWSQELRRIKARNLTERSARQLLAEGLQNSCTARGPSRVALETGCDEKTIRRARDEESTLNLACSWNLLDIDPHALDALAASKGVMLVPLMNRAADIISSAGAAIHRIGSNRAEHSPGGTAETDQELIESEAENDALLASVLERRSRIVEAKLRRSNRAA